MPGLLIPFIEQPIWPPVPDGFAELVEAYHAQVGLHPAYAFAADTTEPHIMLFSMAITVFTTATLERPYAAAAEVVAAIDADAQTKVITEAGAHA